eukprot:4626645-Alexandrium_andersonii.AAC.1
MRAPELAWAAIEGIEPPDSVVLLRRVTAVRRWAEKDDAYLPKVRALLETYRRSGAKGCGPPDEYDQDAPVAGPIALLLRSAAAADMWINDDMQLCAADEVSCGLVGAPAQALRAWIVAQFHRSAIAKMARRRHEFAGIGELD